MKTPRIELCLVLAGIICGIICVASNRSTVIIATGWAGVACVMIANVLCERRTARKGRRA